SCTPLLTLSLVLAACDHNDTPRSTTPAQAVGTGGHASATTAATSGTTSAAMHAPPACVVPTSDTPPPTAQPAANCPTEPGAPPQFDSVFITFADAPGAPRINAKHAVTDAQHQHGLMFVTEMPRDEGMIFSWDNEEIRRFWMHNTCIPLDMMFIAGDGTITGILEQVPVLNDATRSIPCPAQYVLEVNAGWSRRNGVKAGQHLLIDR
ncbi:MAG TPA: DUF192 domain-containing protein, partial [Polyangiaceae bacterium]|nr:DUF192 domain-containing protein [Polyangiaceae bacterium]